MYRTWPARMLVGLILSVRGLLGGRSSPESERPLDLLSVNMLATKTRKSSSHLGHRLAALHCSLLAKPNIAPAIKGKIPASSSSSSIKHEKKKKMRNVFGTEQQETDSLAKHIVQSLKMPLKNNVNIYSLKASR